MKVKLKEDINLKDLKDNRWFGCKGWVEKFLQQYYDINCVYTFEAKEYDKECYRIDDVCDENYIIIPKILFEKVNEIEHVYERTIEIIPASKYLSKNENYQLINRNIEKLHSVLMNVIAKQDELIDKINEEKKEK